MLVVRVSPGDPSASVGETGVVIILGTVGFLVCRVSLIVRWGWDVGVRWPWVWPMV